MKHTFLLIAFFICTTQSQSQPPTGYYKNAYNLTCAPLKTALNNIISNSISIKSYSNLWNQYPVTDVKPRTLGTGSATVIYDIYSSKISGIDPYQFTPFTNQCGTYSAEGSCYNREHSIPTSWFNGNTSNSGTATDYNFIYPTDGFVNNKRANNPYGEVATANYTSLNGSKLGNSSVAGISGTVFEPIDEFKGDVARAFFYFVTMYESNIPSWSSNTDALQSFDNNTFPAVKLPYLKLMLKWHNQDPVSQKEINRNNGTYSFQKNRNPFIDSPQYVNQIWNSSCPGLAALPVNLILFSGKVSGAFINFQWEIQNEQNLNSYQLEISEDGHSFTPIASIKATGAEKYAFQYPFNKNIANRMYYRLKKIDQDGKYSYSELLSITTPLISYVNIYPNPSKDYIYIAMKPEASATATFQIINITGKVVYNKEMNTTSGLITIPIMDIASGNYLLKVSNSNHVYIQKVTIAK